MYPGFKDSDLFLVLEPSNYELLYRFMKQRTMYIAESTANRICTYRSLVIQHPTP